MNELTDEQMNEVFRLLMSPTLGRLGELAQTFQVDLTNPNELRPCLAAVSLGIVRALDEGRIRFEHPDDAVKLHSLLVLALDLAHDGRFRDGFRAA